METQMANETYANVHSMAFLSWTVAVALYFQALWILAVWRRWRTIRWYWIAALWTVLAMLTSLPLFAYYGLFAFVPEYGMAAVLLSIPYAISSAVARPSLNVSILTVVLLTWWIETRWPNWYGERLTRRILLAVGVLIVSFVLFAFIEFLVLAPHFAGLL
jgi:hypothetical protein